MFNLSSSSPEMTIKFTGHALLTILKDLVGQVMTEAFEIVKPLITFSFSIVWEKKKNNRKIRFFKKFKKKFYIMFSRFWKDATIFSS
jgi:hypothetical protein